MPKQRFSETTCLLNDVFGGARLPWRLVSLTQRPSRRAALGARSATTSPSPTQTPSARWAMTRAKILIGSKPVSRRPARLR